MREMKFRGWSTADKKMYYNVWFDNLEVHWFNGEDDEWVCIGDREANSMLHQTFIMQYTGLHDRHDKEIYEGDMILLPGYNKKHRVFMSQGMFCVEEDGSLFPLSQFYSTTEVIGNIYENPKLIGRNG